MNVIEELNKLCAKHTPFLHITVDRSLDSDEYIVQILNQKSRRCVQFSVTREFMCGTKFMPIEMFYGYLLGKADSYSTYSQPLLSEEKNETESC